MALRQYYQAHSIKSDATKIAIPYRYLVPLNITFNWSLQNLSSYYTDLGFVRVIFYLLFIISLCYALVKKDRELLVLTLTTLLGWMIWRVIGSAILWYGTVLISWSAITLLLFVDRIRKASDKEERSPFALLLLFLVFFMGAFQLVTNFIRIGSQGANGPFVRYKGNMGLVSTVSDQLRETSKISYYNAKMIFDLQFPQYNPIINFLKDRQDDEGVIVAGTYVQYFLGNQWNLRSDGLLTEFWRKNSDGDLCKSYRRLKADKTKYLIIDPNIGTVGMGEGNETLFHRFFAKLNAIDGSIEEDGTLTSLVKMYQLGYLRLVSTNNL